MLRQWDAGEFAMANQFITTAQLPGLRLRELSFGTSQPGRVTTRLIRSNYHLHIVIKGTSFFNECPVAAGDVFLMYPYRSYQISVVGSVPLEQYWFGFEGVDVPDMLKVTALAANDVLHVDLSHLFPLLRDGVFGDCHENLLPMKIAGLLKLTLAALPAADSSVAGGTFASEYVNRAVDFLRLNYGTGVSMADVAGEVGITEKYLYKLFRRELGTTPMDYLNQCRISRAEVLLTTTSLSIAEVARQCGFADAGYFSRFYRRQRGKSPTQYREDMKKTLG